MTRRFPRLFVLLSSTIGVACHGDPTSPKGGQGAISVTIAHAGTLPTSIASVVLAVTEGSNATREAALAIAANRQSVGGTVEVAAGSVAARALARNASSTTIYQSPLYNTTVAAGQTTTLNMLMACVHTSCDGSTGGLTGLAATAWLPQAEVEANNTLATANTLPFAEIPGGVAFFSGNGVISTASDLDHFAVSIIAGEQLTVFTFADRVGVVGGVDTIIQLYNPSGALVASNDDCDVGNTNDSCLAYTAAVGGLYRVRVSGYSGGVGRYTLGVEAH